MVALVLAGGAPEARAEHGGEPTSAMSQAERRIAYELRAHINAERAARDLPPLAAYFDGSRAAAHAGEVASSGNASAVDISADVAWYGDRGMVGLDVVNRFNGGHDTSGAIVRHLMTDGQRARLLTRRADVLAVGVGCLSGQHAVTLHFIASSAEVRGRAQGDVANAVNPRVTAASAGTSCAQTAAHPSPPTGVDPRVPGPALPNERIAGPTRIQTAVAISQRAFPDPAAVDTVIVATAANFPDALATGPAAVRLGGPILLTWPDSLPDDVAGEIQRLNPGRIAVVGGPAAVGPDVFDALAELAPLLERWHGGNRIATAAAISTEVWPDGASTVYLAPAEAHAPALAAAVPAAYEGLPLLLTWGDGLDPAAAAELTRLEPPSVVLVGGLSWLSASVADAVAALLPSAEIQRLDADNVYALSALAAAQAPAPGEGLFLATAERYPDALAAAPAVVAEGGRLLLAPGAGEVHEAILAAAAS
ncbi:MAG TPA: cell wall-binding repeat-containing protein, partial [Egibacteraceae bacterium]|nr:cell wall-binding repeat-containing protein [Egibacteraceae bacterium]